MRGADWGDLRVLRDLQKEAMGTQGGAAVGRYTKGITQPSGQKPHFLSGSGTPRPRRVGTGMPPTGVGIDHRNPASTPLLPRPFGGQGLPKQPRPQPQPP